MLHAQPHMQGAGSGRGERQTKPHLCLAQPLLLPATCAPVLLLLHPLNPSISQWQLPKLVHGVAAPPGCNWMDPLHLNWWLQAHAAVSHLPCTLAVQLVSHSPCILAVQFDLSVPGRLTGLTPGRGMPICRSCSPCSCRLLALWLPLSTPPRLLLLLLLPPLLL